MLCLRGPDEAATCRHREVLFCLHPAATELPRVQNILRNRLSRSGMPTV